MRLPNPRTAHPVSKLRWLRHGVLLAILATMLLWLITAVIAHHEIGNTRRTQAAIADITEAQVAAQQASASLKDVFTSGGVALTGTGNDFANDAAQINSDITAAAEGNAAGNIGAAKIQFVLGQLETCIQLAETDVRSSVPAADDATNCLAQPDQTVGGVPVTGTGGLTAALADLKQAQVAALDAQLGSPWLDPWLIWPLLLAPAALMLVFGGFSTGILVGHFRRRVGPLLPTALLATSAAAILVATLSTLDSHRLTANPLASEPIIVVLVLAALATAMALAHFAYRPRLAEYRFPRS